MDSPKMEYDMQTDFDVLVDIALELCHVHAGDASDTVWCELLWTLLAFGNDKLLVNEEG